MGLAAPRLMHPAVRALELLLTACTRSMMRSELEQFLDALEHPDLLGEPYDNTEGKGAELLARLKDRVRRCLGNCARMRLFQPLRRARSTAGS